LSGFLLDTNVFSELGKKRPNSALLSWISDLDDSSIFCSVVTVGELRRGIELQIGDPRRRARHERDLVALQTRYADRILPIDQAVAERWGRMMAAARRSLGPLPATDCYIAATAAHHSLVVATRNVSHFQRAGVSVVNPFES